MIQQWANKWCIPQDAIIDLRAMLGVTSESSKVPEKVSEAVAQQKIVLDNSMRGFRLWRNNCGAATDARSGRPIRYGLANESKKINSKIKSSDLIGITPIRISPAHVGGLIGVFTSIEVKKPGWKYSGSDREKAQLQWLQLIANFGGIATFATTPEGIKYAIS